MKKFLFEYKSVKILKSRSETETSKERERVTVTTHHSSPGLTPSEEHSQSAAEIGTIRTEEYKRDLAEFQARRSSGVRELPDTPEKKKCGRHSLPISCTDCATDPDKTFNYEKKSVAKHKKKTQQRARSANPADKQLPKIQFLFQNQVFMPGNIPFAAFSEPQRCKRYSRRAYRSPENFTQRHIDFKEDEQQPNSPPFFYKNNSLPYDEKQFLDSRNGIEEVDGMKAAGDVNVSSQCSSAGTSEEGNEDKLWEVMSELKNLDQWADEQLQVQSANISKADDNKSDTSAYGLSLASASNLDVNMDKTTVWSLGKWGVVPVQIKTLTGVTVGHVRKKLNTEINILRKCRHPNIILLMGIYPDVQNNINIICERCMDTLYGILHQQGRILSAQTSVQYALDIANALVFLRMQGYIHTALNSKSIMITRHDSAKLADMGPCMRLPEEKKKEKREYEIYSPEPQYVNIEDTRHNTQESEPLISQHASEAYMTANAVAKNHQFYLNSDQFYWHAPELFQPEEGMVYACGKTDVYSLCLILWESCNAKLPWGSLTYETLREQYTLWKTGIQLPHDGTYPGCLLALLQDGLKLDRNERIDLEKLQSILQLVKCDLDEIDLIIIPARLSKKKSNFSNVAWDTSPTDSECLSPENIKHKAVVHTKDSSTESDKDCSKTNSPIYETLLKHSYATFAVPEKCYVSDEENVELRPILKYHHLPEKDFSSACSTPISKVQTRIKDIGTPGQMHRSDSTEYCSILSPYNRTRNFTFTDDSVKDRSSVERPAAKLSRSFTPKSYKPLHIKVPEYNLNCIRSLPKDKYGSGRPSYNFDIKNYSLPTTPIARSNKLRKNAWLSGDNVTEENADVIKDAINNLADKEVSETKNQHKTPEVNGCLIEKERRTSPDYFPDSHTQERSAESVDTLRDCLSGLKRIDPPEDFQSPETSDTTRERTNSWSCKPSLNPDRTKYKMEEDALANVNVKPLVAIHEKWIFEANRKTGRSMSLPENHRNQSAAVKPASHCVDTLQKSLPQLNVKRMGSKCFKMRPSSPANENGAQWEQFCQARDNIAKKINFSARDPERFHASRRDVDKGTTTVEDIRKSEPMIDQGTDTRGIEEFIRELIRKEFQHIFHEMQDDVSTTSHRTDDIVNKGIANIIESLNNNEENMKKDAVKSFSRVKINGNNKPLLQITFSRCGENSLQVLDNCVNVTICDSTGKDKNQSTEDTLTEDVHVSALKRCQAFNALQEARSTEDLYIDDELSTQIHDNFGKMRLIPLHGSLHEILCEKEDDCCLIKVKQENGCDTIYFRCDHSDTGSRDAVDGCVKDMPQDTVVFKRSISLVEERIQRIFPHEKRPLTPSARKKRMEIQEGKTRIRPKSENFLENVLTEKRFLSNSSPSLAVKDDALELNIENVLPYHDSSSDECLKCQADNDDFEYIERKIEEDLASSNISNSASLTCGCLEKISEENLSVLNEDTTDRGSSPDEGI